MKLPLAIGMALGTGGGLALALLLLHAGASRRTWAKTTVQPGGFQEASITINGRYQPETIQIVQGLPVRLHFYRKEDNPCSERIVFAGFGIDRRLPPFQETTVEFLPVATGTFLFTCQWGMYRGKLVVTAPSDRPRANQLGTLRGTRGGHE
ncbi:MAG: cupredoxin domain-containing protein [Chloroflexi bacterium]|nr:cupredoxin domain-containing protein [Chloroflexota bacterium]